MQRLESFESIPDYPGYLVHILTHLTSEDERFRSVAGLLLKNNLGTLSSAAPALVAFVKESVLSALGDPIAMVRQTVGTVIVSLLNDQGVESWPEALAKLMGALDSPNTEEQEVSSLAFLLALACSGRALTPRARYPLLPRSDHARAPSRR